MIKAIYHISCSDLEIRDYVTLTVGCMTDSL